MRLSNSLLLASAASAAAQQQQVLKLPKQLEQVSESWGKSIHELEDALKSLTDDARAVWDEVANLFPEQMSKANFFSTPKKHTRRPDSHWDHIVRGEDVQGLWVNNAEGEKEREISGKLESYDLRVKKVDPSELGVDPNVTQYSGYLDDNENDKHLFYCKAEAPDTSTA